jgi:hypothetical protein
LRLCISAKFRGPYHSQSKESPTDKFRQLEEVLPTPNEYRTAAGAPGHKYWQQRADYNIKVEVDDEKQRIIGSETIDYHNVSPDTLSYLGRETSRARRRILRRFRSPPLPRLCAIPSKVATRSQKSETHPASPCPSHQQDDDADRSAETASLQRVLPILGCVELQHP